MADANASRIELDEDEAREVISALNHVMYLEGGEEGATALDVRELLRREFGFKDDDLDQGVSLADLFTLEESDDHEVRLSREEAAVVDRALADHETGADADEAAMIADLRDRIGATDDLSAGDAS